ncbi:unnamed protein product, partial [Brassica oleracea var. botrytis]
DFKCEALCLRRCGACEEERETRRDDRLCQIDFIGQEETTRFAYYIKLQVNTSFPLDLCVISSNESRLLLCWTGASHPATNWLREYQQPSASAVRPFNP